MDILDLIFSNLAFSIALIWFVFSMFGKKEQEEQERRRHPRPVAQPIEVPRPEAQPREESRPVYQSFDLEESQKAAEELSNQEETVFQRTAELLAKAEEIQNRARSQAVTKSIQERNSLRARETALQETILTGAKLALQEEKLIDFSQLDRKSIVQGMVWSQVFGLPRAKEPYRSWPRYMYTREK